MVEGFGDVGGGGLVRSTWWVSDEVVAASGSTIELKLGLAPQATTIPDLLRSNYVEEVAEDRRLKLTVLTSLPDVLTIVVNRQGYNRVTKRPYKITTELDAPENLVIPADLLDPKLQKTLAGEAASYSLVHVVHHSGTTTRGGHYTSYGKTADDRWYRHDDTGAAGRRTIPYASIRRRDLRTGYVYVYSRDR